MTELAPQQPDLTRADVSSISVLTDAYESVQVYIQQEAAENDQADIAKAQGILSTLNDLIESEAAEPNDNSSVEAAEDDA